MYLGYKGETGRMSENPVYVNAYLQIHTQMPTDTINFI